MLNPADGRWAEIQGHVEIEPDPHKAPLYNRCMDAAGPPPKPESDRLIVRVTQGRVFTFPPAPSTASART